MAAYLVLLCVFLECWEVRLPLQSEPPTTRPATTQPVADASWHRRIPVEWELSKQEREAIDSWRQMLEEEGMDPDEWPRDVEFSDRYWNKRKELTKEDAFAILLRTETVADVAVGYGGDTPPQFYALAVLLKRPDAAAVFADLHERAQPAGRIYALCALRDLDRETYASGLAALREANPVVQTFSGCIKVGLPMLKVLDEDLAFFARDEALPADILTPFDRRAFLWTRFARDELSR